MLKKKVSFPGCQMGAWQAKFVHPPLTSPALTLPSSYPQISFCFDKRHITVSPTTSSWFFWRHRLVAKLLMLCVSFQNNNHRGRERERFVWNWPVNLMTATCQQGPITTYLKELRPLLGPGRDLAKYHSFIHPKTMLLCSSSIISPLDPLQHNTRLQRISLPLCFPPNPCIRLLSLSLSYSGHAHISHLH